ncbi:U4/U6 x U5 tri-snRNP complex subunit Prp1, partial [Coemansia erecta]
ALETVRQGLAQGPLFEQAYKLWLLQAQIEVQLGRPKEARQTLSRALKSCPESVELWIAAARLEASHHFGLHTRARAILERARVYVPRNPHLWLEAVCLECDVGSGGDQVARALLARALQECPKSGILWAQAILLEPRQQRKAKSVDALKVGAGVATDPALITMVARLFWSERRLDKARSWFERATRADPDYGDAWAWWLRFELDQGSDNREQQQQRVGQIKQLCEKADPHHGQVWPVVAKDPSNARLPIKDILQKVAHALGSTRQF